jgi:hypothetical protein
MIKEEKQLEITGIDLVDRLSPRQMSLSLSKTELAFIQGSREFTKEQARVLRYRINKKLKNQAKAETDNQNQLPEHSSAVFGMGVTPYIRRVVMSMR